ncbi:Glu-tRNA(Gln) amidotransferase subunit GatD [Nanoarchaeota archaeon]
MNIRAGDRVKLKTEKEEIEGVLMPSSEADVVVVKLDNGYNIGINKNKIKNMKMVEKHKEKEIKKKTIKEKTGLPTITILHMGGTIASKVDYATGAVKPKFTPSELLELFPELGEIANIKSRLVGNLLSGNMRFSHYNLMAKEIEKAVKEGVDGIIVTHGTDTLHYTSAALAFALEDLGVPVILVGSQRSSDRGSSDASMNLICAAQFVVKSNFAGVAMCMHKSMDDKFCGILPATKTRKFHSSRRDTFKVINAKPWAEVSKKGEIKWLDKSYDKKDKKKKLSLKLFKDLKIGILKAHPNMFVEEIKAYSSFDGIILEGTGLGHFPVLEYDKLTAEHTKILKEIEKLAKKMPMVMTSQTIYGRVDMNVYAYGRELLKAGVLGNYADMTAETAFVKLAWLLSNKMDVKENISKSLRREINERIESKEDFLE